MCRAHDQLIEGQAYLQGITDMLAEQDGNVVMNAFALQQMFGVALEKMKAAAQALEEQQQPPAGTH